MHYVEEVGLPKFDFLGIRNLSILADAVKIVEKIHGVKVDLDRIDLEDKRLLKFWRMVKTMGLFQLNGSGMTALFKTIKTY